MMRPFSLVLVLLTWFSPCFGDDLKDRLTTGLLACADLQDKFESSHFCTGEILASAQEQGSGNRDLVYLTKSRFFTLGGIDQDTGEKFLFTGRTSSNLLDPGLEFRVWYVWLQVGAKQYWFRGELGDRKVELTDLAETKETPTEPIFTHHVFIRPLAVTNQWTSGLANSTWISTLLDCTIDDLKANGKRASGTFVKEASRANVNCKFQITVDSQWDDLPVLTEMFELPEAGNLKKVGRMLARTETSWKKMDDEYFPVKFDGQNWEGDLESSNETSLQWRRLKKSAKSPTPEFFQSMSLRKSDDELFAYLEDTFSDMPK